MTNWANFFLPHLAQGTLSDPLSLAMASYTSLRMGDYSDALVLYTRVLRILRNLLRSKDAAQINNQVCLTTRNHLTLTLQDFLRVWATSLFLAQYESILGNHEATARHVEGATTLCLIGTSRFAMQDWTDSSTESSTIEAPRMLKFERHSSVGQSSHAHPDHVSADTAQDLHHEDHRSDCHWENQPRPLNERLLPGYLSNLTKLVRNSSLLTQSLDIAWPIFQQHQQEETLEILREKSAECFAHVFPLTENFYTDPLVKRKLTPAEYTAYIATYQARYVAAYDCIQQYRRLLSRLSGPQFDGLKSCAKSDFPFSPDIEFVNPHMAQVAVMPALYTIFLAPFVTDEDHEAAVRYVSAVFGSPTAVQGIDTIAVFPDVIVAAFWKVGEEREYFRAHLLKRQGIFVDILTRIWSDIDAMEKEEGHRPDKADILGIALNDFWFVAGNTYHTERRSFRPANVLVDSWCTRSIILDAWSIAIGALDPIKSETATEKEKERRRQWPDVSFYRARITLWRLVHGHNASEKASTVDEMKAIQCQAMAVMSELSIHTTDDDVEESKSMRHVSGNVEDKPSPSSMTPTEIRVRKSWTREPDISKGLIIL